MVKNNILKEREIKICYTNTRFFRYITFAYLLQRVSIHCSRTEKKNKMYCEHMMEEMSNMDATECFHFYS